MDILDQIAALETGEKIALVGITISLIVGLIGLGLQRRPTRLAKKTFEADNVPEMSVEVHQEAHFPGFPALAPGNNYCHRPPDPFAHPIPLFVAVVKNQRRFPVTISNAGLVNKRTKRFIPFPPEDIDETRRFPPLPHDLLKWNNLAFPIAPGVIKDLLEVIETRPNDEISVRVIDAIDRPYDSEPEKADRYLNAEPYQSTVRFTPLAITQELGEEEYFPDGIFPGDTAKTRPADAEPERTERWKS